MLHFLHGVDFNFIQRVAENLKGLILRVRLFRLNIQPLVGVTFLNWELDWVSVHNSLTRFVFHLINIKLFVWFSVWAATCYRWCPSTFLFFQNFLYLFFRFLLPFFKSTSTESVLPGLRVTLTLVFTLNACIFPVCSLKKYCERNKRNILYKPFLAIGT